MHKLCLLFLFGLILQTSLNSQAILISNPISEGGFITPKYGLFEASFQITTSSGDSLSTIVDNFYDTDDIKVEGLFYKNGVLTSTRPGFFYQSFCKSGVGNCSGIPENPADLVETTTTNPWRVRFAPDQVGDWTYKIKVTINQTAYYSSTPSFYCSNSTNPGFVGVAPNKTNFKFDDGPMYFPIGENLAWYAGTSPEACPATPDLNRKEYSACVVDMYDKWLDQLADNGGDFTRLMFAAWSWELDKWNNEGTPGVTDLGNFNHSQFKAHDLDEMFEMFHERGIYVQMALYIPDQLGELHTETYGWEDNPYRIDLGLNTFPEFFTNTEAKRIFKNRLWYIVGRWGWSPNLFAYEPLNEAEHVDRGGDSTVVVPDYNASFTVWYKEMADYIKLIDKKHMVTASCAASFHCLEVFNHGTIDFSKAHSYSYDKYTEYQRNYLSSHMMNEAVPGKPFMIGEYGTGGKDVTGLGCYTSEPSLLEYHNTLWAHSFSGAAATPQFWYWESITRHPKYGGQYRYLAYISAFFNDIDLDWSDNFKPLGNARNLDITALKNANLAPNFDVHSFSNNGTIDNQHLTTGITTSNDDEIEVFALKNDEMILGWVHNIQNYWFNVPRHDPNCTTVLVDPNFDTIINSLNNETMTINGLRCNGTYEVEWYNTHYDYNADLEPDHPQTLINADLPSSFSNPITSSNGQITVTIPRLQEIDSLDFPYAPDYGFKLKLVQESSNNAWKHVEPGHETFEVDGYMAYHADGSVFYRGMDGYLQQYWSTDQENFCHTHISSTKKVHPNSEILIFDNKVFYYDDNKRIRYFEWNGSNWIFRTPVQSYNSNVHSVEGNMTIDKSNGSIYYRGKDDKLQQYYQCGNNYCAAYLDNANDANKKVHFSSKIVASNSRVFYFNENRFMRYFEYSSNSWNFKTPIGGTSNNDKFSGNGMTIGAGNIYYRGQDGKVHQFYKCGSNYCHSTLNSSTSNNITANPSTKMIATSTRLYYFNTNGYFRYFEWSSGSGWQHKIVSASLQDRGIGKIMDIDVNSNSIYYKGLNNNLQQYWLNNGTYTHAEIGNGTDNNIDSACENIIADGNQRIFYSRDADEWLNFYIWDPCSTFNFTGETPDTKRAKSQEIVDIETNIYPNPLNDNNLKIEIDLPQVTSLEVNLVNTNGSTIKNLYSFNKTVSGFISFDVRLDNVPAGIYFIEIITNEGRLIKKLVKV